MFEIEKNYVVHLEFSMMDFRSMILWMGFNEAKIRLKKRLKSSFSDHIIGHFRSWFESFDMSKLLPGSLRVRM